MRGLNLDATAYVLQNVSSHFVELRLIVHFIILVTTRISLRSAGLTLLYPHVEI